MPIILYNMIMRIKKKNKVNKKALIIVIALLIVGGVVGCAYMINSSKGKNDPSKEKVKEQKKDHKKDRKKTKKTDSDTKDKESKNVPTNSNLPSNDGKTPRQQESNVDYENSPGISGTTDVYLNNNNGIGIRTTIVQTINDPNGTCDLTLIGSNGRVYTERLRLIEDPHASVCYGGWDVSAEKLGGSVKGHWKAEVVINAAGRTATIVGEANL